MAFGFGAEDQRKWIAENQPKVQEKLAEPIVSYSVFQRSGGFTRLAVGKASPLASLAMGAAAKKKAAGLPNTFILALTPTKLHAFAYRQGWGGLKVRDELAVWDRAAIRTTVEPKQMTVRLVIESPSEGERVECEATKSVITDDFLAALAPAQAATA